MKEAMVKKKGIRFLSLLGIAGILLTGCGSAPGTAEKMAGSDQKTAGMPGTMGRYMEDISPIPEEINRNSGLNFLDDGSMVIISYNSGCYKTTDKGKSWKKEEVSWFPMIQEVYCLDAAMGPDGAFAATCSGQMPEAARKACSKALPEDWDGNYCIFAFPDGRIKAVDFGFSQEDATCISSFVFKEDGRLFAGDLSGRVYEVDMEKEKLTELFMADRELGYMDFSGDTLMAVGHDRLYLYDLAEGVLLPQDETADLFLQKAMPDGTVSYTGGGYPVAVFGGKEDTVYIACEDGLYRHALGGSMIEQVVDGALSTFGDTSAILYSVKELENQEFLALFNASAGGLIRYTFDETVPSMPEKEIRIYSLEENKSIRQAATAYKKEHTDIYVRYEVGVEGEEGITKEDAVRRLNTQALAGDGPDVMVLDGLPMDSYIEKGMLRDLSGTLSDPEGEEELFPNLVEGFTDDDGRIYVMPMCIRAPILAGEQETIANMKDLESFADGMEKLREKNPQGGLLGIYDAETVLRLFSMVSSPAWMKENGEIDREAVEAFLRETKRIYDAELSGNIAEDREVLEKEDADLEQYGIDASSVKMEACQNVLNIPRGYAKIAAGYLDGIQLCLDNVTSIIRADEKIGYQSFCGQVQDAYIPVTMVGISANTEIPGEAEEFVRGIFGMKTQEMLYEGFPVNRAAFAEDFAFYAPNADNGTMTLMTKEKEERELMLYWPDEEEERAFTELVNDLKTPVIQNDWLEELVCSIGTEVLEGKVSVEDGASEIEKRAAVYLAE